MPTAQLSDQQVRELGAKLKSARETQRRDISDSAFRIALSPSQLRALEAGDRRPFYSTSYFLQAVERYAAFLSLELEELHAYRAQAVSAAAPDPGPEEIRSSIIDDTYAADELASHASPKRTAGSAPPAPTIPQRQKISGTRKPPLMTALLVGASVIALATMLLLQDNPAPIASKPAVEPQAPSSTSSDTPATTVAASDSSKVGPSTATTAPSPPNVEQAAASAPPATASVQQALAATDSGNKDGRIQSAINAWVQIVSKSGEKSNLRIAAGESIGFVASETAAVVIGQPERVTLTVRGRAIDLKQHIVSKEGSPRALIIIGDVIR